MMVKKQLKIFSLFALALLSALLCCLAFSIMKSKAEETQSVLQEEYLLNETLEIPDYEMEYNGEKVLATDYSLEYPNGIVRMGQKQVLDTPGLYTVHYAVMKDGRIVKETKTFIVQNTLYATSQSKSSVYYGKNSAYADKAEGLVVSLAQKDTLTFNKILDLSKMTKADNLLSFYITPIENGTYDATRLTFRFTDIYDEENWIEIQYRCNYNIRPWAQNITYTAARSNGNPWTGWTYFGTDLWGWSSYQSFCGTASLYNLSYDNAGASFWSDKFTSESQKGLPVADLDDDTIFTNPWQGFTTGEVKMSIYATSYNAPTMNIVLTHLAGNDLQETTFVDKNEPVITLDYAGNDVLPEGLKGVPYKIFNATATDDYSGNIDVKTNVYFKYGTLRQINVYTENGYFIPAYEGLYTIEYKAQDQFGNIAVKTVDVVIGSADDALKFEIVGAINQAVAGEKVQLMESFVANNQKGNITVEITATCGNESLTANEAFEILPLMKGTYTVNVVVSDYVETVEKTFALEVLENPVPVFVDDVNLVDYFICGQRYSLPEFNGYDISSGVAETLVSKIYISEDGGAKKEVGTNEFTVNAKDNVEVIYEIANGQNTTRKSYNIPAVNAITEDGNLDITKYFDVIDGECFVTANTDNVVFATTEDTTIKFINAVQMESFITRFKWGETKRAFDGLNVYLTDSTDESNRIKITYTWVDEIGYISINDANPIRVPTDTTTSDKTLLTLGYKNETKQAYGRSTLMMNITNTIYGEEFKGFAENMAYIEYELFGVTGEAELNLLRINNQAMFDFVAPDFMEAELFFKRSNGDVALGDQVVIYGARAYDVLSSKTTLSLKVTAPDGSYVTAIDGTVLDGTCDPTRDYIIKTHQYGGYTVGFTTIDGADVREKLFYGFACIDKVSPTISVNGKTVQAKVGDTLKVKDYKVSDNISKDSAITVYVCVLDPDYLMQSVVKNQFTVRKAGVYTVYYYASDANGNMSIAQYDVVVV